MTTTMREPEAIKLFVGQVPKDFGQADLQAIFEPYGSIHSLNLLQDKATGQHKGCAFLTYYDNESAKAAQEDLHEKRTLPGARNPIQVKPAASETNAENRKLFVGMVSRDISDADLKSMFSPFGGIEDVTILKDAQGKSKGCAFIKFETRLQAQNAIKGMHNSLTMEGCSKPIVVKLADTEKDKMSKKILQNGAAAAAAGLGMPGIGGVGQLQQTAYYQQLLAQMTLPQIIAANSSLAMPGATGAVTNNAQPGDANSSKPPASAMQNPIASTYPGVQQYIASLPQAYNPMLQGMPTTTDTKKEGPEGANLFIYQLPSEYTDADLVQTFLPFGNVLSAKVFIDKKTQMSKGFGFVSYDNPSSASAAIATMNGFIIGTKRLKVQIKRSKDQGKPY